MDSTNHAVMKGWISRVSTIPLPLIGAHSALCHIIDPQAVFTVAEALCAPGSATKLGCSLLQGGKQNTSGTVFITHIASLEHGGDGDVEASSTCIRHKERSVLGCKSASTVQQMCVLG